MLSSCACRQQYGPPCFYPGSCTIPDMALLSSSSLRVCARPTAAPHAAVVVRPAVVCRAKTDDALKVATDLLGKGMEAAKSIDTAQVSRLLVNCICCLHSCLLCMCGVSLQWSVQSTDPEKMSSRFCPHRTKKRLRAPPVCCDACRDIFACVPHAVMMVLTPGTVGPAATAEGTGTAGGTDVSCSGQGCP